MQCPSIFPVRSSPPHDLWFQKAELSMAEMLKSRLLKQIPQTSGWRHSSIFCIQSIGKRYPLDIAMFDLSLGAWWLVSEINKVCSLYHYETKLNYCWNHVFSPGTTLTVESLKKYEKDSFIICSMLTLLCTEAQNQHSSFIHSCLSASLCTCSHHCFCDTHYQDMEHRQSVWPCTVRRHPRRADTAGSILHWL